MSVLLSILQTLVVALITFVFGGLLGNWLVQRWQQRNWLNQQRFQGKEKEYQALKDVFDEIVSLAGRRITRMRKLQRVLSGTDDEVVKVRLREYDKAQTEWNDRLNSFYVRLRLYANYEMVTRLERIQKKSADIGGALERAIKLREQGTRPASRSIADDLDNLYGLVIDYTRDMLRHVEDIKRETYFGVELELRPSTLEMFPTSQLFKSLFKPRVPPHSIIRTTFDLVPPKRRWD